ncbi:hypothetical protein GB937_008376 [Aspergillus fischeri]|nr:hypothetical protein GB937_008376 [Aspergillus fischeri]
MTDLNNKILHANCFAPEVAINAVVPSTFLILNLCSPAHLVLPGSRVQTRRLSASLDQWLEEI